ncbi:hypothetical protein FGRMN_10757 [Fusarium graminum]|nr:hypothetical protein FGRMN_10757 [Fusarium graminum]
MPSLENIETPKPVRGLPQGFSRDAGAGFVLGGLGGIIAFAMSYLLCTEIDLSLSHPLRVWYMERGLHVVIEFDLSGADLVLQTGAFIALMFSLDGRNQLVSAELSVYIIIKSFVEAMADLLTLVVNKQAFFRRRGRGVVSHIFLLGLSPLHDQLHVLRFIRGLHPLAVVHRGHLAMLVLDLSLKGSGRPLDERGADSPSVGVIRVPRVVGPDLNRSQRSSVFSAGTEATTEADGATEIDGCVITAVYSTLADIEAEKYQLLVTVHHLYMDNNSNNKKCYVKRTLTANETAIEFIGTLRNILEDLDRLNPDLCTNLYINLSQGLKKSNAKGKGNPKPEVSTSTNSAPPHAEHQYYFPLLVRTLSHNKTSKQLIRKTKGKDEEKVNVILK